MTSVRIVATDNPSTCLSTLEQLRPLSRRPQKVLYSWWAILTEGLRGRITNQFVNKAENCGKKIPQHVN
ncbi:hypothetical protein BPAE_0005g01300 [Botrytis paeoniae]|uniref:Uncharacterized protein n=1 Tax=Botrytis paeoniae TaxID=278948 RepID=A0A4Z1G0G4_9HELO|nr:hypothetical protein BPAE_0005g01300 [Botrytis paeoniae]